MEDLIQLLLRNLTHIGIGVALFVVAYVSNMAYSLYYNIKLLHQPFDAKKLLDSVIKILAFGVGTTLLCVGITFIPIFADYVGLTISEEYQEIFSNLAILIVFIVAACKYLFEAYGKLKDILNYPSNKQEIKEG